MKFRLVSQLPMALLTSFVPFTLAQDGWYVFRRNKTEFLYSAKTKKRIFWAKTCRSFWVMNEQMCQPRQEDLVRFTVQTSKCTVVVLTKSKERSSTDKSWRSKSFKKRFDNMVWSQDLVLKCSSGVNDTK